MDIMDAIRARHSVRQYTGEPIAAEHIAALEKEISLCNEESGLHIQLITGVPDAFSAFLAHYGWLSGASDYIALVGKPGMEEACGYYGERLVLQAQMLGLNTCWLGGTYRKGKADFKAEKGEKLYLIIAVGYGKTQGTPRRSKSPHDVSSADREAPDWFRRGVDAALLAPTAVNQQRFKLILHKNTVTAKALPGAYSKIDIGIVKYHFEIGAGKENFHWAE